MGKTVYKLTRETSDPGLLKGEYDDKGNVQKVYCWNVKMHGWKESWDTFVGYFVGFEPSWEISEEEAKKYMV